MALPETLRALAAKVSNRGRWGPDDERGTLNLIDDAAIARGLAAARQGRAFSLAIAFNRFGPQMGAIPGRTNPELEMIAINHPLTGDPGDFCSSDDRVSMGVQAATHWDALAHVGYDHELYNGNPDSVVAEHGATRLSIEAFGPVVTRAVLLDVARLHGVEALDSGYPISGDDLEACARAADLSVEPGDAVLVRTGHLRWFLEGDRERYAFGSPGLSTRSIEWIRDHDVAAVANDTLIFEVFPPEDPAVWLPVHMIHLRDMGLIQGQNFALEELGAHCEADGQYEMLLCATPVPLTGSTGGIVAPTAVK